MESMCKAAKDIAADAEAVHKSVPCVDKVYYLFANLRQQRYHDVLLNLRTQMCIAEHITSKEENISFVRFWLT